MKEQQKHIDAYNEYFLHKNNGLTPMEAVRLVASKFGVSDTSVFRWMKAFDWKGREAIQTHDVQNKTIELTNNALAENKARYLKNLHDAMSKAESDGSITILNMNDYEKATKLALTIQGDEEHDNTGVKEILEGLLNVIGQESGGIRTRGVKSRWDVKDK